MPSKTKKTLKSTSFFISLLLQLCFANEKDLNKNRRCIKSYDPCSKTKKLFYNKTNPTPIKQIQHQL